MRKAYMADVGDGLCLGLSTLFGRKMQIDCGGERAEIAMVGLERALENLGCFDTFMLSHFHLDHYNGLLHCSLNLGPTRLFKIREVYYPRIPKFAEREEFLRELFTMNLRLFGDDTGIMEYDLLKAVSRINCGAPVFHRGLSRGDLINISGSIFEVLWPPKVVENRTLAVVKKALRDFEKALEDPLTKELYAEVSEEGYFKSYFDEQYDNSHFKVFRTESPDEQSRIRFRGEQKRRKLPKPVIQANKSLDEAANHLSLAFFEDNRFIFLGDTESSEIRQVVDELTFKNRRAFYLLVTPHHGTHWDKSLKNIKIKYAITSSGKRLCSRFKTEYRVISQRSLATFTNGNILIGQARYSPQSEWLLYDDFTCDDGRRVNTFSFRPSSTNVSAGGITFTVEGNKLQYLLLRRRSDGSWDFPIGKKTRKDISPEDTAKREIKEETGIGATLLQGFACISRYSTVKGASYDDRVLLFLAEARGRHVSLNSREHDRFDWCSMDEALQKLSFSNSRDALLKAHEFLVVEANICTRPKCR